MLHKTLLRQIKKHASSIDPDSPELAKFLQAVSDTYAGYDEDHALVERSLDLSSKELVSINERIKQEGKELKAKSEELERFNRLMIGRELQMIELKKQIRTLRDELRKTEKDASK